MGFFEYENEESTDKTNLYTLHLSRRANLELRLLLLDAVCQSRFD